MGGFLWFSLLRPSKKGSPPRTPHGGLLPASYRIAMLFMRTFLSVPLFNAGDACTWKAELSCNSLRLSTSTVCFIEQQRLPLSTFSNQSATKTSIIPPSQRSAPATAKPTGSCMCSCALHPGEKMRQSAPYSLLTQVLIRTSDIMSDSNLDVSKY